MKRIIASILVLLALVFSTNAQITINSQKTIGGSGWDDVGLAGVDSFDNHFIIGASDSDISFDKSEDSRGDFDIWVVKTDGNNNILWDKTIGGSNYDSRVHSIIVNDTVFIACSSLSDISGEKTMDNFGLGDIWLLALNLNGDILWQESYGGSENETYPNLVSLPNGNLLLSCNSYSGISGNKDEENIGSSDFWLVELNSTNGSLLQQKTIGSVESESLIETIISPQQTITIMGSSVTGISGDKTDIGYGYDDIWIVELDMNFNVLKDKCFGGNGEENKIFGAITFDNNSYYIACSSSSNASGNKTAPLFSSGSIFVKNDYWLIKTDHDFNIIWDKAYGDFKEDNCTNILLHDWNKLVLSGASKSGVSGNKMEASYGGYDGWIVILDKNNGDLIGQKSFGGIASEGCVVHESNTNSQGLNLYCGSSSDPSGNKTTPHYGNGDAWILNIDASDFLNLETIVDEANVALYPNPFKESFKLTFDELKEPVTLSIYTSDGRLLSQSQLKKGATEFKSKYTGTSNILFYELKGQTVFSRGKLVKM